jgi:hypothetical protein
MELTSFCMRLGLCCWVGRFEQIVAPPNKRDDLLMTMMSVLKT